MSFGFQVRVVVLPSGSSIRVGLPWAQRLMPLAWGAACLLVLPLVVLAYKANLDESPWLQESAQARIVIWHSTAKSCAGGNWENERGRPS